MPTNRRRVGRTGGSVVTAAAVKMYRRGVSLTAGRWKCIRSTKQCNHDTCDEHRTLSFALAEELRADPLLPCLLDSEPVFLLAVDDETPFRETWHELKSELEAAVQA